MRGMVRALMLLAVWGVATAARAGDALLAPFDPAPLSVAEVGLLELGLAASGDGVGSGDGRWGGSDAAALAAYAGREFGDAAPLNLHAAALVIGLQAALDAHRLDPVTLPEFGISLALPRAELGAAADAPGSRRWTGPGLELAVYRFDAAQAETWHRTAADAAAAGSLATERTDGRRLTAGDLADGWSFRTRSDRVGGGWTTVEIVAAPGQAALAALVAATVRVGPPADFGLPAGGRLEALLFATLDLLERLGGAAAEPAASAAALPPLAAELPAEPTEATGSGFFVGERLIVTADHVVAGCGRVTLADGTALDPVAADPGLDVALLASPAAGAAWLTPAAAGAPRLGLEVHAAGYPYYSVAGTSLHLTGGNVSATAGVDDDVRFFSFTAPVQPGNSGGPVIDATGAVVGVVVSRLNERFVAEATGTLPQNVNYALSGGELAGFLARAGVTLPDPALTPFDTDLGLPDAAQAAIVPILCR